MSLTHINLGFDGKEFELPLIHDPLVLDDALTSLRVEGANDIAISPFFTELELIETAHIVAEIGKVIFGEDHEPLRLEDVDTNISHLFPVANQQMSCSFFSIISRQYDVTAVPAEQEHLYAIFPAYNELLDRDDSVNCLVETMTHITPMLGSSGIVVNIQRLFDLMRKSGVTTTSVEGYNGISFEAFRMHQIGDFLLTKVDHFN